MRYKCHFYPSICLTINLSNYLSIHLSIKGCSRPRNYLQLTFNMVKHFYVRIFFITNIQFSFFSVQTIFFYRFFVRIFFVTNIHLKLTLKFATCFAKYCYLMKVRSRYVRTVLSQWTKMNMNKKVTLKIYLFSQKKTWLKVKKYTIPFVGSPCI